MVNPTKITNFSRTKEELEYFWIFCILVAGKNADWAVIKLNDMFKNKPKDQTPLQFLKEQGNGLHNMLVANKVGQYYRIVTALTQSMELDLKKATIDQLTNIFGVGPKTARFFLVHSRKSQNHVILDTHILKWLNKNYPDLSFPNNTPPMAKYNDYERLALKLIKARFPNLSIAQADLLIWTEMSGRLDQDYDLPE